MALTETGKAIGAVTQLLKEHLLPPTVPEIDVTVGRPEDVATSSQTPKLNLFLYEIQFDASLRNRPLDHGQPFPLWLVLKYLLTAIDTTGNSDSILAHGLLGEGLRALQELALLPLISSASPLNTRAALQDNPEPLKITFDQTPSDLLSKVMQGSEEKYRCSVGFEVRPVMIATRQPSSYSLLVGINYETNTVIGAEGIKIPVLPSMGPMLKEVFPLRITPVDPDVLPPQAIPTVTMRGQNLALTDLSVQLGDVELAVVARSPGEIQAAVNGDISDGAVISAGSHALRVVQALPENHQRSSNLLVLNLLPLLNSADYAVSADPDLQGVLTLTGRLLGTADDDIFVALYRAGTTVQVFDTAEPVVPPPPITLQTQLRVPIRTVDAAPVAGDRIILRVNGQQANHSPLVTL
ncbi:Pvc16 family protein [Phormidium tenue]|uniref:Pvc16 N-terminal domain-containing protein n=1 Tax=Phormidium tenue NIES-30 TaxID=549789 RepID=A0A1U7IYN3_9CYAN|nr:Pvc16 family protein [Phormidium tenue]MBD2232776.1 DUF4255 domain-containing protein [Phormidium tenue FACHB-1052]OKH43713.1 hypothetical protein NIES30_24485 [Phormidium tenue NIES-30]